MSTPREPAPGRLVLSALAAPDWWELSWPAFRQELQERFGPVDYVENRATSSPITHSDFNRADFDQAKTIDRSTQSTTSGARSPALQAHT